MQLLKLQHFKWIEGWRRRADSPDPFRWILYILKRENSLTQLSVLKQWYICLELTSGFLGFFSSIILTSVIIMLGATCFAHCQYREATRRTLQNLSVYIVTWSFLSSFFFFFFWEGKRTISTLKLNMKEQNQNCSLKIFYFLFIHVAYSYAANE